MLAQPRSFFVVQHAGVLPISTSCQHGGTRGLIALLRLEVVGSLGLLGESVGVEASGQSVAPLESLNTKVRKGQPLFVLHDGPPYPPERFILAPGSTKS